LAFKVLQLSHLFDSVDDLLFRLPTLICLAQWMVVVVDDLNRCRVRLVRRVQLELNLVGKQELHELRLFRRWKVAKDKGLGRLLKLLNLGCE
jgi:hypothetical protein